MLYELFVLILLVVKINIICSCSLQIGVTVLEDNIQSNFYYLMTVVTGWVVDGGTTSLPCVYLEGTESCSDPHVLRSPNCPMIEAGTEMTFLLTTRKPLGEMKMLHIWISCTGNSPSWYSSPRH